MTVLSFITASSTIQSNVNSIVTSLKPRAANAKLGYVERNKFLGFMFDLQPNLKGELLELRPLREEDFDALFAVASDPLIWEQHPDNDRYQESVFRDYFRGAINCGGAFIILDAKDGRVLGSSRYNGYNSELSEIEIGWTFLSRDCWGGSYNAELKSLMLAHAFEFVKSVTFCVGLDNRRSRKALEKIGAVEERTVLKPDGRRSVVYRISAR